MSSIKKAISKVVHGNHSRTHSKTSSTSSANGDVLPFTSMSTNSDVLVINEDANGDADTSTNANANADVKTNANANASGGPTPPDGHRKHVVADQTGGGTLTAAQRQQEEANRTPVPRPNNTVNVACRNLSFTEQKEDRKAEREAKDEEKRRLQEAHWKWAHSHCPLKANWGDCPLNMSQWRADRQFDRVRDIPNRHEGDSVIFRARVHHLRPLSTKMLFIVLRHRFCTIQGVLREDPEKVSQLMIRWARGIPRESIVIVDGVIQRPPPNQAEVHGTTIREFEIRIKRLFVVAAPSDKLPFQVEDVSRPKKCYEKEDAQFAKVGERTRLDHRVLDLRSPACQSIFRIQAGVCELFRSFLNERGFTEIHSSKFQGASTESGAAVFKVDYFRRPACLAQSPQLAKQMCIAADMERVFEIGPVFRAENSNTHRHLTEFTGLDLEMSIETHYHEVLEMLDECLKFMFKTLLVRFKAEIDVVKLTFPHNDVVILDETPRLKFAEGIRMLKESGWKGEYGKEPSEFEDLSTRAEQRLGQLVKEKYGADYYILDKFPLGARPFYTMPDHDDDKISNSFDFFLRGEEILSGGQRIHDAPFLEQRMRESQVDPDTMNDYVEGFKWGCPPHGGGGVGLERIVMLFLKLGNIRWASLFPRDPRSFGVRTQDPAEAAAMAANALILHGPESETFLTGKRHPEMPPLENLIAKYGDATNTSWVDPAWTIWRDKATAAAVGYIPQNSFAVIFGSPLCPPEQTPRVAKAFLAFLHEQALKPVWCCMDKQTERYLAEELGWAAVLAVAEERINPTEVDPAAHDKTVRRKIHRAEREGVRLVEVGQEMDRAVRAQLEQRCRDWEASRKGTQIHLTGVRPFDDVQHRRYFYAVDKTGKPCAMVVLAQLAPKHGFQIKWALEFPGAPLGAIEYILAHVIKKLGDAGVKSATFGAGATGKFQVVENIHGFRVKTLEKAYNGLSATFNLTNKGDFRSKFGTWHDPLYICYPKGGLGMKGIEAIMSMLQKPK